ncbi:hypothetical protein B5S30_g750 [[Candida] boidinii]|nr:hypothetical protein B5S30_g750 [[Candida] boidinii]GMF98426.1 unnamed protein product [[Candida] boidinii]
MDLPDSVTPRVPIATSKPTRSSKFTFLQFLDINSPKRAYLSPLAVIAHLDVNAFFAQAEQIRLGLTSEDPVVCLQWNSLIAVSYAARKYGIGRMDTLLDAKKKCPNLIVAHTAVFKKGDPNWFYTDINDDLPSAVDHKVSLDPYRKESRKFIRVIKDFADLVEKVSVDECFIDFGRLVYEKAVEIFPELDIKTYNDPTILTKNLPDLPEFLPESLNWQGHIITNTYTDDAMGDLKFPSIDDWDDIFMLIGSNLALELRTKIENLIGYTTSCGVARVKTLAKLASGFKKPDNQTIVKNNSIDLFLENFSLTDFWGFGGKTGDSILLKLNIPITISNTSNTNNTFLSDDTHFNDQEENDEDHDENGFNNNISGDGSVDTIGYIRKYLSLQDLELKLKDKELAEKVFQIVRGDLKTELTQKTEIKSMICSKNFRNNCVKNSNDLYSWFRVFASELKQRIQDLDEEKTVLESGKNILIKRPRILSFKFHSAHNSESHSRQTPIPVITSLDQLEQTIYNSSCKLLDLLEKSWSDLTIHKMYPSINCSITISKFENIDRFNSIDYFLKNKIIPIKEESDNTMETNKTKETNNIEETNNKETNSSNSRSSTPTSDIPTTGNSNKKIIDTTTCEECDEKIPNSELAEHLDMHYAKKLAKELNGSFKQNNIERHLRPTPSKISKPTIRKKKSSGVKDKSQKTLPFL